jgi:hypothetical protein
VLIVTTTFPICIRLFTEHETKNQWAIGSTHELC